MPRGNKRTIRLWPDERAFLVHLYWEGRRSTDQLGRDVETLAAMTRAFNAGTPQEATPDDLLHYMIVQRKRGRWVRLGDRALHRGPRPELTSNELAALIEVAHEMAVREEISCCRLMFEPDLRDELRERFAARTGKLAAGTDLVDALISIRKDGLLPRIYGPGRSRGVASDDDAGFGDIDLVA